MTITNLSEYSMVITKDSEDKPWLSISQIVGLSVNYAVCVTKYMEDANYSNTALPKELVGSGITIIAYFNKDVSHIFKKGDRVVMSICGRDFGI